MKMGFGRSGYGWFLRNKIKSPLYSLTEKRERSSFPPFVKGVGGISKIGKHLLNTYKSETFELFPKHQIFLIPTKVGIHLSLCYCW